MEEIPVVGKDLWQSAHCMSEDTKCLVDMKHFYLVDVCFTSYLKTAQK